MHLPLLRNMRDAGLKAISEVYGLSADQARSGGLASGHEGGGGRDEGGRDDMRLWFSVFRCRAVCSRVEQSRVAETASLTHRRYTRPRAEMNPHSPVHF